MAYAANATYNCRTKKIWFGLARLKALNKSLLCDHTTEPVHSLHVKSCEFTCIFLLIFYVVNCHFCYFRICFLVFRLIPKRATLFCPGDDKFGQVEFWFALVHRYVCPSYLPSAGNLRRLVSRLRRSICQWIHIIFS